MKQKIQRILHKFLCLCAIFTMASCTDKCSEEEEFIGSITFNGTVNVSPAEVTQGDDVIVTIRNHINNVAYDNQLDQKYKGKYVIKSITYFIDGRKVAESSDRYDSFKANFNTSDLTPGIYSVTARCESGFDEYTISENIVAGELTVLPNYRQIDHCDLVGGYMFSEDVLLFLEPLITIYVDGLDPIEIPVTKENMISTENDFKFNSISVHFSNSNDYYCWEGIQIPQQNIKGHFTVSYKEKYKDYSEFEPFKDAFTLSVKPFVYAFSIPARSTPINIVMLSNFDITIGGNLSVEDRIQKILNSGDNTIDFDTTNNTK